MTWPNPGLRASTLFPIMASKSRILDLVKVCSMLHIENIFSEDIAKTVLARLNAGFSLRLSIHSSCGWGIRFCDNDCVDQHLLHGIPGKLSHSVTYKRLIGLWDLRSLMKRKMTERKQFKCMRDGILPLIYSMLMINYPVRSYEERAGQKRREQLQVFVSQCSELIWTCHFNSNAL